MNRVLFPHKKCGACIVMMVFLVGLLLSCNLRKEDITLYVLLEDVRLIDSLVSQYNKSQNEYRMRYRAIENSQLRDVLENNIQRENLFLLVSRHDIPQRAKEKYFAKVFPTFNEDVRATKLTRLGKEIVRITLNYTLPIYFYDVDVKGTVKAATISIPLRGYDESTQVTALKSVMSFFATPAISARALIFENLPVYNDAGISVLTPAQVRRVSKDNFPLGKLDEELLPVGTNFIIEQ